MSYVTDGVVICSLQLLDSNIARRSLCYNVVDGDVIVYYDDNTISDEHIL